MRIGLIDVDSHNFPNLVLMKISAWYKAMGCQVEWYDPWRGYAEPYDRVYMSKVFSFSYDYEHPVYAKEVIRGGTGYHIKLVDGKEVFDGKDEHLPYCIEHVYPDYSLYPDYTKDTAYGFLTRGCPRGCHFCHVACKEGQMSRKVADITEFWDGQKMVVLNDPNILACKDHMDLLQQLVDAKVKVDFNQGLDIRMVNDRNIELIKQIPMKYIHFAYDRYQDKDLIEPKLKAFRDATGYDHRKVMVYILTNFDTTLEQDLERIEFCRSIDFDPFVMIYDKEHADPVYKKLQRWCNNNFIFYKVAKFEEYR